jgi:hypothetical protein
MIQSLSVNKYEQENIVQGRHLRKSIKRQMIRGSFLSLQQKESPDDILTLIRELNASQLIWHWILQYTRIGKLNACWLLHKACYWICHTDGRSQYWPTTYLYKKQLVKSPVPYSNLYIFLPPMRVNAHQQFYAKLGTITKKSNNYLIKSLAADKRSTINS